MLNTNELNFDDAKDFYEQMQIDEILMRENEPFEINGVSIVKGTENNEEWLNVLCGI